LTVRVLTPRIWAVCTVLSSLSIDALLERGRCQGSIVADKSKVDVREILYFPAPTEETFKLLDPLIPKLPEAHRKVADALRYNLSAAIDVLALPVLTANHSVMRRVRGDFAIDAHDFIQDLDMTEREREVATAGLAFMRFKEWAEDPANDDSMLREVVLELQSSFRFMDSYFRSMRDLLRQGAVLVWGALEVLLFDAYELRFGKRKDGIGVRTAFLKLIPYYDTGDEFMADMTLRDLFYSRHLIVHRCSIVDEEFIRRTGSAIPLGKELFISPKALREHIDSVIVTGIALVTLSAHPPVDNGDSTEDGDLPN
jgi:hypothetical protein